MTVTYDGKNRTRRGFTIMELLVVILIMGILMSMVIGLWKLVAGKGRETKTKAELQEIAKIVTDYQAKYGRVPEQLTSDGVVDEIRKILPRGSRRNNISDPWERPYIYTSKQGRQSFTLYSRGRDERNDADNIHSDHID